MSDATEKTTDFMKDLGDAARRNPVSTALIGMGLLWLFTGGKSVGRAGDLFRSAGVDRLPDTAQEALGNVGSGLARGCKIRKRYRQFDAIDGPRGGEQHSRSSFRFRTVDAGG